jgi:hypothetical protein
LSELYRQHKYVVEILDANQRERFARIKEDHAYERIEKTFKELFQYLRSFYGCRCVVLIDEYDHPLDVAFHNGYYEKACKFFGALLGGLLKVCSF